MKDVTQIQGIGKCKIYDLDTKELLRDKCNAIHPINLATVFMRSLAHMPNANCYRMAFGNGGTIPIIGGWTHKSPNNGVNDNQQWQSTLYNEVYYEVIDATLKGMIGTGPGSSSADDDLSVLFTSGPGCRIEEQSDGSTSLFVTCMLNKNEPSGQNVLLSDTEDTPFVFDEIGLYTKGSPKYQTSGYQYVSVGTKNINSLTGLSTNATYYFNIKVDNDLTFTTIEITTPTVGSGSSNRITYGDLITLINNAFSVIGVNATCEISDPLNFINTYGYLSFRSNSTGTQSKIELSRNPNPGIIGVNFLFTSLAGAPQTGQLLTPVQGKAAGIQHAPTSPETELERLLCHVIFDPIKKASNKGYIIVYELNFKVV